MRRLVALLLAISAVGMLAATLLPGSDRHEGQAPRADAEGRGGETEHRERDSEEGGKEEEEEAAEA